MPWQDFDEATDSWDAVQQGLEEAQQAVATSTDELDVKEAEHVPQMAQGAYEAASGEKPSTNSTDSLATMYSQYGSLLRYMISLPSGSSRRTRVHRQMGDTDAVHYSRYRRAKYKSPDRYNSRPSWVIPKCCD